MDVDLVYLLFPVTIDWIVNALSITFGGVNVIFGVDPLKEREIYLYWDFELGISLYFYFPFIFYFFRFGLGRIKN